ncbi:MAG: BACON domain-containing protein [Bacteroidales bacterium]|nr:BACON domain-containing protein [Bacteroidales bacterium]
MKKSIIYAALAAITCLVSCKEPIPVIPAEVSVSPSSVTFEAEGGTLNVAVTTNKDSYTVTGAPSWLSVKQNGKEISLTAEQNSVNEERTATIVVAAEEASCNIEVKQKPGSPYPGFQVVSKAGFEYAGTMIYQFAKPQDGYDGGQGYLVLEDEDGNQVSIWIYTELFASEEDVVLNNGTYTKGEDAYPALVAKKMTWMAGTKMDMDDDESFIFGSYYADAATEKETPLVSGTVEVSQDKDAQVIKADLKDAAGNDYKYVYIGEVEIDAEGAGYPSENDDRIDVAGTVFGADCMYMGEEDGKTMFRLMLYSGDEEDPAMTNFEFLVDPVEFSEDYDLSGIYTYSAPSEDEEEDEEAGDDEGEEVTGTLIPGSLVELFPGFSMPMGTYVMYSFGDYLLGDAFDSLSLERQEDGSYALSGAIMSSEGEFVFFLNVNVEIPIIDGTEEED